MNDLQRKALKTILEALENLSAELAEVQDEEQEACDNITAFFENSPRAERMEEVIYQLDEAFDSIESAIDSITEALN